MVAGAGPGDVGVVIVDPQGRRDTVEVMLEDKGDNIFRCTYRPVLEGTHTICVTYAGAQIPKSPFAVNVSEGESCPRCPHPVPTAPVSPTVSPWHLPVPVVALTPLCLPCPQSTLCPQHVLMGPFCPLMSPWVPHAPGDPMAPTCPQGVPLGTPWHPCVLNVSPWHPYVLGCPQGVTMGPLCP